MVDTLKHRDITDKIIRSYYTVYNALGHGFLESVYRNSMAVELARAGLQVQTETPIDVYYRDGIVGQFFADIIVEKCVIIELKAAKELAPEHHAQLFNYLKASRIEVGLLMNFGKEPKYERKYCANMRPRVEYKPRFDKVADPTKSDSDSTGATLPGFDSSAAFDPYNPPNPLDPL